MTVRVDDQQWEAPKLELAIKTKHRFRFMMPVSAGVTRQPVTGNDLLGLLGVATSATGVTSIVAAVKIHSITIRVPNYASSIASQFASVFWDGQTYQAPSIPSEVAMSMAKPAVVVSQPPPQSDASFWITYGSRAATIFRLTAPQLSVIDLNCTIILQNATLLQEGGILTYVSSGLTAGQVYFGMLDKNTGTPKITPVEVTYYG